MKNIFQKFVVYLGFNIKLEKSIPDSYLMRLSLQYFVDILRGLLFTRRLIAVGHNTQIMGLSKLTSRGGLVRFGRNCEIDCLSKDGLVLGRNFKLGSFSKIKCSGSLQKLGKGIYIGDGVGISEFAYLGGTGGVSVGDDCIIGQYFSTHPENHIFGDPEMTIKRQGTSAEGIQIGNNCWIGSKVTVLDGASIGSNSVVAAGSVVRGKFKNNLVIGGVPAKIIGRTS